MAQGATRLAARLGGDDEAHRSAQGQTQDETEQKAHGAHLLRAVEDAEIARRRGRPRHPDTSMGLAPAVKDASAVRRALFDAREGKLLTCRLPSCLKGQV